VTWTFLQKDDRHDTKVDDIPNNANGDGNLDYLSLLVKVAHLSVVANLSANILVVGNILFLWKIFRWCEMFWWQIFWWQIFWWQIFWWQVFFGRKYFGGKYFNGKPFSGGK